MTENQGKQKKRWYWERVNRSVLKRNAFMYLVFPDDPIHP